MQITKIRSGSGDSNTENKCIRESYRQLYTDKLDNLVKMKNFLKYKNYLHLFKKK